MPQTLRHTVARLAEPLPLRLWSALLIVAVGGSLLFGGSISLTELSGATWRTAIWFAAAAGAAWCVFIPATRLFSGKSWVCCVTIGLWTMAAGEAVLLSGAALHLVLWWKGAAPSGAVLHVMAVALSNVVMALVFTAQFRAAGVPLWQPLAWWLVILNGAGAAFFAAGHQLLLAP